MSKRDEMAETVYVQCLSQGFTKYESANMHKRYSQGWDAALLHDERVVALVEAIEEVLISPACEGSYAYARSDEALTQYRGSVKK